MKGYLLALALLLAGCGVSESSLVGRWRGSAQLSDKDSQIPFSGFANGIASSFDMKIKADHTFEMMAVLMPIEGTWSLHDSKLVLVPKEVFGYKDPGKSSNAYEGPFEFAVSSDGKRLEPISRKDEGNPKFTFEKLDDA